MPIGQEAVTLVIIINHNYIYLSFVDGWFRDLRDLWRGVTLIFCMQVKYILCLWQLFFPSLSLYLSPWPRRNLIIFLPGHDVSTYSWGRAAMFTFQFNTTEIASRWESTAGHSHLAQWESQAVPLLSACSCKHWRRHDVRSSPLGAQYEHIILHLSV